jgi:uncharacterized phage-like protein YoqJ
MELLFMKIAFTGHRPQKMGGFDDRINLKDKVIQAIDLYLLSNVFENVEFISGMALGVDLWVAEHAFECNIPFHAYIPFVGQESIWPEGSKKKYIILLDKAKSVKVCSEGLYAAWKMQKRNECMVDDCDILIAVWDKSSGGTANCVKYAQSKEKTIHYINPKELQ